MNNTPTLTLVLLAGLTVLTGTHGAAQVTEPANHPVAMHSNVPIKILCIGDSITQGGRREREEWTYRLPLQRLLHEQGLRYDFVGAETVGLHPEVTWPEPLPGVAFDPAHEGHYGWETAAVRDRLQSVISTIEAPDLALIHLGTNDQNAADYNVAVFQPLDEIIGLLRERNPYVVILLGHLNFNGGNALRIRPFVERLAKLRTSPWSPVQTVHHYEGWIEDPAKPDADTFDWAHPNPSGQLKMADNWLKALLPFIHCLDPNGDFDGDGHSNLLEHATGSDPQQANSADPAPLSLNPQSGTNALQLTFPQVADPSLAYQIWQSNDLQDWGTAPFHSFDGSTTATEPARVTLPAPQTATFYQLRIRRTAPPR